jgi:transposase
VRGPLAPVGPIGLGQAVEDRLADPPPEGVEVEVGGDGGRPAVLVARVEDEIERLLDPVRLALAAEVVEHQVVAAGQEVEPVVDPVRLVAREAAPESEEEVRDVDEDGGVAALDQGAGDGDRQVGLPRARRAGETEPGPAFGEGLDEGAAHRDDRGCSRGDREAREARLPVAEADPGVAQQPPDPALVLLLATDKLDARGLNRLQQSGTLPTVWIPRGELRDQRDLPRTRMVLVRQRTQLKNRIHAALAKYALHDLEVSDLFGVRGRALLRQRLDLLPPHTAYATQQLLEQVEALARQVREFEQRIQAVFKPTPAIQLLLTLPGVGLTLAVVITLEVGDVARFATAEKLAGYAGTTPRVDASAGKTRYGQLRPDVNRYLKWAFVEAANAICLNRGRAPRRHVSRLYERIARRKGHQKAIGAVARHVAEATYWILSKQEPYREPSPSAVSSTGDKRG